MAQKEMTRYAFISHMEDYIKKLLVEPSKADTDDFLKSYGITGPVALQMLLKKEDPNDPNSAIITRTERIKDGETDENGKRLHDTFNIKYRVPRKDYTKKMRNLYISKFENYIIEETILNEDGECAGATTCDASSGQFVQPLFGKPIRRTIHITEEQLDYIKKVLNEDSPCVMNTMVGDFGYDAPFSIKSDDPSLDHKNMFKKGMEGQ